MGSSRELNTVRAHFASKTGGPIITHIGYSPVQIILIRSIYGCMIVDQWRLLTKIDGSQKWTRLQNSFKPIQA